MRHVRNAKEFWQTVKKFTHREFKIKLEISMETCVDFFKQIYTPTPRIRSIFERTTHDLLDAPITLEELEGAISHLKTQKACGPDEIPNECFKFLSPPWTHYILNMFNFFLREEYIPDNWCQSMIKLIYKKGDKLDPGNYRPIALENAGLKLFMYTLNKRLYKMTEDNNLLPEEQCGFRKNRSCVDNLFILRCIIDIQRMINKKMLLCIFVDYKKAFDTVPHDKLFQKLDHLGINGKFMRIVAKMYDQAKLTINVNDQLSESIKVTKGVLQGDVLSPLLYTLYTSDMRSFFVEKGHRGVKVDDTNILLTTFADDTAIFASSTTDCQDKLNDLYTYCELNDLTVNASKTNILYFFRGRPKKLRTIYYQNTPVQYVKSVKYLGVNFTSSGKFSLHASETMRKAHLAAGKALSILSASKSDTWSTKCTLFDSLSKSHLLYACEMWAYSYSSILETVQSRYFKSLLHLSKTTPNYMVRKETQRLPIEYFVMKSMYDWWTKLLAMPSDRLPRICYVLLEKHINQSEIQDNWANLMKQFLYDTGRENVWLEQDAHLAKKMRKDVLNTLKSALEIRDTQRIVNSSYTPLYHLIIQLELKPSYIYYTSNIKKLRTVAQLRLCNLNCTTLYLAGQKYVLDETNNCSYCNLNEPYNLSHIFFNCPIFNVPRQKYLNRFMRETNQSRSALLASILSNITIEKLNYLFYFINECTRIIQLIDM